MDDFIIRVSEKDLHLCSVGMLPCRNGDELIKIHLNILYKIRWNDLMLQIIPSEGETF